MAEIATKLGMGQNDRRIALGGGAAASPLPARVQQAQRMRRIGVLSHGRNGGPLRGLPEQLAYWLTDPGQSDILHAPGFGCASLL